MTLPLSLFLIVLGGILLGTFSLPVTRTPDWKFEHIWFVGSLLALLVIPWPLVFLTVPDVGALYASVPPGVLVAVILSGAAWGIGGIFWGRGIETLGMALGVSLMMTLITVFGSAGPLAIFEPAKFATAGGLVLSAALAVMIVGVVVIAIAGSRRAAEQAKASPHDDASASHAKPKASFAAGISFAIISGILSAGVNFGFVFGGPLAAQAAEAGVSPYATGFAIWSLVFSANYAINAIYGLWMMIKNGTLGGLFANAKPSYWLGALFMGTAWPGGVIIYGIGAGGMGAYGAYVGFPMMLLVSILSGNAAGALTGEWKGTTTRPRRLMVIGVVILLAAFVLLGVSNNLLATS
jgi:L-rhamnose-H+ transport protein